MTIQLQILLIAILVSVACVLPGIFLVLRGVALMSDAISHAILPGIAIMFLLVQRLDSPLLIIGASLAGLLTVFFTEALIQTERLKKDAAIGLVFPLFFSIGVIIISQCARNVHLDTDMVLLGELAFAPFNRLVMWGVDLGAQAAWIMGAILLINALFVFAFYKELALITFDATQARLFGFLPVALHYGLMTITSITAVGAFDVVGSIVVVALMITPPATAYLLTNGLPQMVAVSIVMSVIASIFGCLGAMVWDVSIAGSIATMTGILFVGALFFAPRVGILVQAYCRRQQRLMLAQDIVCFYLKQNFDDLGPFAVPVHRSLGEVGSSSKGRPVYASTSSARTGYLAHIASALGWDLNFTWSVVHSAQDRGLVIMSDEVISLTPGGWEHAQQISTMHAKH